MDAPADTVRYLSLDWIEALGAAVAEEAALQELAATHRIGVTQSVTGGPEGLVVYHLQVGEGAVRFGAGQADPEDVRFDQSWETAVAVATGTLNAQHAFLSGRIRMVGDQQLLMDSRAVFAALDAVFARVRERTEYR